MIRVFIVDDHDLVRHGLADIFRSEPGFEVAGEAEGAEEALARVAPAAPDVAIIDVRLPDGNGVEVCREIRSSHPKTRCVIFTSYSDDEALFNAILSGASGYLIKSVKAAELVDSVRRVAAGESLLDPIVTTQLLERLQATRLRDQRLLSLTAQERRILELIGEGLSNHEIATRIHLAEKTVKNYVSSLLDKLGMERRTQAAVFADRLAERRGTLPT